MDRCSFCQFPFAQDEAVCPCCGREQPWLRGDQPTEADPDRAASRLPMAQSLAAADHLRPAPPEEQFVGPEVFPEALPDPLLPPDWPPGQVSYQEFPDESQATWLPLETLTVWPPEPVPVVAVPASVVALAQPMSLAPPPPQRKRVLKVVALVLAALVVLAASSGAAYLLTRPRPLITVNAPERSGSLPAGSPDMVFHVRGQDFTANSPITFLLDGQPAPGAPKVTSDSQGNMMVDLPITDDWLIGRHRLTARDAHAYVTKTAVTLEVLAAPVMVVTSRYQQGDTPVGSRGTIFELFGRRFALAAAVTVLLDESPLTSVFKSDGRGRFDESVTVDAQWTLGNHILTAIDAAGDVTQHGGQVVIVPQGVAHTPGPNGAPPDDGFFGILLNLSAQESSGYAFSFQQFLSITGRADPAGGVVCSPIDDGQPHTYTGTLRESSVTFTETLARTCSGLYKSGHLTYTETVLSDQFSLSDGRFCASQRSYVYGQFAGTFSSALRITGIYQREYFRAPCSNGSYIFRGDAQGTWTGTKS